MSKQYYYYYLCHSSCGAQRSFGTALGEFSCLVKVVHLHASIHHCRAVTNSLDNKYLSLQLLGQNSSLEVFVNSVEANEVRQ